AEGTQINIACPSMGLGVRILGSFKRNCQQRNGCIAVLFDVMLDVAIILFLLDLIRWQLLS
ncbi:hypothetical protein ACQX20_08395, partial [Corynebacterium diphtheriae]